MNATTLPADLDELLDRWADAEEHGDTEALAPLLVDDFVGVGPLGFALPKPAWVGRHAGGELRYESFELHDVEPHLHGDSALVTLRHTAVGAHAGTPLPRDLKTSVSAVRDDEGWRLAGVHFSFIAGTPDAPPLPPAAGAGHRDG